MQTNIESIIKHFNLPCSNETLIRNLPVSVLRVCQSKNWENCEPQIKAFLDEIEEWPDIAVDLSALLLSKKAIVKCKPSDVWKALRLVSYLRIHNRSAEYSTNTSLLDHSDILVTTLDIDTNIKIYDLLVINADAGLLSKVETRIVRLAKDVDRKLKAKEFMTSQYGSTLILSAPLLVNSWTIFLLGAKLVAEVRGVTISALPKIITILPKYSLVIVDALPVSLEDEMNKALEGLQIS